MESKTEQSGNERLSWHELNAYTTARLALRQINDALSRDDNADGGEEKNEILEKAGEFIIEATDAVAGKKGDYSELLAKATDIGVNLVNSGLIGEATEARDKEILEVANYIGLLGMRLTEERLDLEGEGLPYSFVKFKALDYTTGRFKEAAKINPAWDRRISDEEFMSGYERAVELVTKSANQIKENVAKARFAGQIDFANGAAHVASSALAHVNAGLADEKDAVKAGLHERSARVVMSMYDALVSDDALYSAKRLFEGEKESFASGNGPNGENASWELDAIVRKFETYEKAVDEAKTLVYDIAKNELIGDEGDARPIDGYLVLDVGKIRDMGQEMLGSTIVLFENTFGPAAQSYSKLDAAKARKCIEAEERLGTKLQELSMLYQTCNAVMQHAGEHRVSEPEFEMYRSMVKQQMTMPLGEGRGA